MSEQFGDHGITPLGAYATQEEKGGLITITVDDRLIDPPMRVTERVVVTPAQARMLLNDLLDMDL